MPSPFSPSAFDRAVAPMYDETVVVSVDRSGRSPRQCLKVAVFDDPDAAPIDENALETDVETIRCIASGNDWLYVRDCMARGDTVRRQDGRIYNVTKFGRDETIGWFFSARRKK